MTIIAVILLLFVGYIYTDFSAHLLKKEKYINEVKVKEKKGSFEKIWKTLLLLLPIIAFFNFGRLYIENYQIRIIDEAKTAESR